MRRVLMVSLLSVLFTAGGALAYKLTRPPPPPPAPPVERTFEEIQKAEMEEWMQDIGYTE